MGGTGGKKINLTLKVWRQKDRSSPGRFETYEARDISTDMSFLEMLDVVNEQIIQKGGEPIAFDHDCREGICGTCGIVINGHPHGPRKATTTCQLHMRSFKDGDTLWLEPWRANAFPVLKDLIVDRSAFDRIIAAGGFISVSTGSAPDGNAIPVPKADAELAMDAAQCIGCGACLSEQLGDAVCGGEGFSPGAPPAGPAGAPAEGAEYGGGDGCGRVWHLHESWRMRSGLPQGNPPRVHRADESGLHQGCGAVSA
jgi:succinate dehydrogenase/fumarate reductase-like Fe-S protein